MARNRFALCCALRHIYFNDYGLDKTFIMSDLLALTAYYSDQNTPPEIVSNQKKLHLWLTKVELIKKLEQELAEMKHGRIAVSDTIYQGVRTSINSIQKHFNSEAKHCTLTVRDDAVMIDPY